MAGGEICTCIPIEPLRDQVKKKYKNIRCGDDIHKKTWSRYPCKLLNENICKKDHCDGKIIFSVAVPARDIKVITALFIREDEKGYAYLNRTLRGLFEEGILEKVLPVERTLNVPIESTTAVYLKNPPPAPHYSRKK